MIRSPRSSPERRLVPAALLLAGSLVLPVPAAAQPLAPAPGEAQKKAREALADSRFQRSLPAHQELRGTYRAKPPQAIPDEPPAVPESEADDAEPRVSLPSSGVGAVVAKAVFTVLLVVVGGLIVSWIAREVVARRRRRAPDSPLQPLVLEVEATVRTPASFDDASRLAGEGRYAEAVHALLLAAIRHFAARAKTPLQASRTSRELVRLLPLAPDAREAFAELVRTVELSLFGGGEVGAEDYERSRARFQSLTGRAA